MSTLTNATNSTNQNHRGSQRNMTRWKRMGSHRNLIREAGCSSSSDGEGGVSDADGAHGPRRQRSTRPTPREMFEKRKESLLARQIQDLMQLNDDEDDDEPPQQSQPTKNRTDASAVGGSVDGYRTDASAVGGSSGGFHHRKAAGPGVSSIHGSDASSLSETCSSAPSSRKESEAGIGIEYEDAASALGEEDFIAPSERVVSVRDGTTAARTEKEDTIPLSSRTSSLRSGKGSSSRSLISSLRSGASGSQSQKKCVRWEDDPVLAMTPLEEYQLLRDTLRKTRASVESKQVALGDLQTEIQALQERLSLTQEQNQLLEAAATAAI